MEEREGAMHPRHPRGAQATQAALLLLGSPAVPEKE